MLFAVVFALYSTKKGLRVTKPLDLLGKVTTPCIPAFSLNHGLGGGVQFEISSADPNTPKMTPKMCVYASDPPPPRISEMPTNPHLGTQWSGGKGGAV